MLSVYILDRDRLPVEHNYTITVERHNANARGGPRAASLSVTGPALPLLRQWLGFYVIIINGNGRPVWWGKITAVSTPYGRLTLAATLDDMHNRVKVVYTAIDNMGLAVGKSTAWVEHQRSIAAFGRKEWRYTLGVATAAQANAAALTLTNEGALGRQDISLGTASEATLECAGLWDLLDWVYYDNGAGYQAYGDLGDTEAPIGWAVTSNQIGFANNGIHHLGGSLGEIPYGQPVTVAGSVSNNGTKTATGSRPNHTYTATTISFNAGDDILDSAAGLSFVRMGSFVKVAGSASNSRNHLIDTVGANAVATAITVTGGIVSEAAGPSITLTQAASIDIEQPTVTEVPGATVTLSMPAKVAQSFTIGYVPGWTVGEIVLQVRAIGTPVDMFRVAIHADSAGAPGTLIASSTASITGDRMNWHTMTIAAALTAGATYWMVVDRTGSSDAANYYSLSLLETGTYKRWNGSAWISAVGSFPYQLWGAEQTTKQIENILIAAGQFFLGVNVRASSGVPARQYREGNLSALTEVETLLATGTNAGETLLATVTEDWRAVVTVAPDSALPDYTLTMDGTLVDAGGSPVEEGLTPVGAWCAIDGDISIDSLAPASPFLIGYIEWADGRIRDIKPYGKDSAWDLPTLLQG